MGQKGDGSTYNLTENVSVFLTGIWIWSNYVKVVNKYIMSRFIIITRYLYILVRNKAVEQKLSINLYLTSSILTSIPSVYRIPPDCYYS